MSTMLVGWLRAPAPQNRWVAQIALIQFDFPEKRHHPLSGGTP
jgi:hypothetical protein